MNSHEIIGEMIKQDSVSPGAVRSVTYHLGFNFAYKIKECF